MVRLGHLWVLWEDEERMVEGEAKFDVMADSDGVHHTRHDDPEGSQARSFDSRYRLSNWIQY